MDTVSHQGLPKWLRVIFFLTFLYLFFVAIGLMGDGFKLLGQGFSQGLINATKNPFTGLMIGILATSVVQSSSFTTATVVTLIGGTLAGHGGDDPEVVFSAIHGAVPIIMGANIGTSVTNLIVSMGHIGQSQEFERAFAGATMHDFFNLLSVVILLPLEAYFGFLTYLAIECAHFFVGSSGVNFTSPITFITKPVTYAYVTFLREGLDIEKTTTAIICVISSFALLFMSLIMIVKNMRALMLERLEVAIDRLFGAHPIFAILVGAVITAIIQSSSITTSLLVPLIGAGAMSLQAAFPITLGANIGTTITALLAAMAMNVHGLAVAFVHLGFNVLGVLFIYTFKPIRMIPIRGAVLLARVAVQRKWVALVFILGLFYVIPLLAFGISHLLGI